MTTIRIDGVEPFADSTPFGATGAYERVKGKFFGELDSADPRNGVIVNLDKARRNSRGRVEYEIDFFLLRPADSARGNRALIYDVTNRGRMYVHWRLMDAKLSGPASSNDPRTVKDAGNGLFLRRGYTLVWSGWDSTVPAGDGALSLAPVIATDGGRPIVQTIRDELVSGTRGGVKATFRLSHEAASLDQSQARLTVRRREIDRREEVPRSRWAYANAREIRLLPEGTMPEPGALYELHYPAMNPHVLGVGFAATRDFVSFLRSGRPDDAKTPNPIRFETRAALAFGISQAGRFLRDFVREGFNRDGKGGRVFDGMLSHTAGVGGVFLNHAFGQPGRTNTQHEDHAFPENAFPFSAACMTDPVTGTSGSRMRNDGADPLWMESNTSTEYWQKGASLLTTDPLGARDVELPVSARVYFIAGTQHAGQAWMESTRGACVNPRNPHSPTPALRALLIALDEWVDGKPPPASRVPSIRDGTLVAADEVRFPDVPGMAVARRANAIGVLRDWIEPALDMSRPYRALVPQVDADGNETSGVRLPEIGIALATYTGWNLYREPYPEGELCDRDGSCRPLAATRAEREAAGDPRPSLAERYGDHAEYVRRFERYTRELVAQRLLLAEDAERLIARAQSSEIAQRFAGAASSAMPSTDSAAQR
ncbi:MAG: alpha/beta hydrolase domain-containing protein [Burkholderiales bacterium]